MLLRYVNILIQKKLMNQENIKHVAKETSSKKPDVHLNLTFQAME